MLVKEKIASLRRMLGLSSAELAEKIGVTQSTISRYEKGYVRIIPHDKLVALSVVFHCTLEELLGNDPLYSMNDTDECKELLITNAEEIKLINWFRRLSSDEQAFLSEVCQTPNSDAKKVMLLTV